MISSNSKARSETSWARSNKWGCPPKATGASETSISRDLPACKADSAVPHGRVIHVLDLLKQASVSKIAFGVTHGIFPIIVTIVAGVQNIKPILMTAAATGLALVPLLIAGTIPGHEIEHPMAVVILGGLITSTTLNLFVMPALYLRFGRSQLRPAPATAA